MIGMFLLYVLTRLTYRATSVEPAIAREFRSEMRSLYWISVVAIVGLPIISYVAAQLLPYRSPWIVVAVGVATVVGSGMIVGPVVRLRRLLRREGFAPLFARVSWLIPATYGAVALLFCGLAIASQIDNDAFRNVSPADGSRRSPRARRVPRLPWIPQTEPDRTARFRSKHAVTATASVRRDCGARDRVDFGCIHRNEGGSEVRLRR